jgi:hypothetical protein
MAIYVGDTAEKWAHFDEPAFKKLGVAIEAHGLAAGVLYRIAGRPDVRAGRAR